MNILYLVKNGNHHSLDENHQLILKSVWTKKHKHQYQMSVRAFNALIYVMFEDEYAKIYTFKCVNKSETC